MNKIVLLRGINVAGQKKIKMANLRSLLRSMGFENAQTYIQSGNIILSSQEDETTISRRIGEGILREYGWEVPVITVSVDRWRKIMKANPFNERDEKRVGVVFLDKNPSTERLTMFEETELGDEEWSPGEKAIYLYLPNGFGRAKLNNNFIENKLKVQATTRNWKTVKKLGEMGA